MKFDRNAEEDELIPNYKVLESNSLTCYEFDIDPVFPLVWLANQDFKDKSYLRLRDEDKEFATCGNLFLSKNCPLNTKGWTLNDIHNFLRVEDQKNLNIYCHLGFWQQNLESDWRSFNKCKYIIPQFEIIRKNSDFKLLVRHWNEEDPEPLFKKLTELHTHNLQIQSPRQLKPEKVTNWPTKKQWIQNFEKLKKDLSNKVFEKIVLARKTTLVFKERVSPFWLLAQLPADNSYQFLVQSDTNSTFLGSSPEQLFSIEKDKLYTEAIAGTRPRGRTSHEDKVLEDQLLNSEKDLREHQIVVNYIKKLLANYSNKLDCPGTPVIKKQSKVQHLKTPIIANNFTSMNIKSLLNDFHPTPAVATYPKESLNEIKNYESFDRGLYAGTIGLVNKQTCHWFVSIRSALIQNHEVNLYAGVGCVKGSEAQKEWDEADIKIAQYMELFK